MTALFEAIGKAIDGWKTELGILAYLIVRVLVKLDVLDGPDYSIVYDLIAAWTGVAIKAHSRKGKLLNDARAQRNGHAAESLVGELRTFEPGGNGDGKAPNS